MSRGLRPALIALAAVVTFVSLPETAYSQSRSLQSGPVVRRQLLFRSDRMEVAPSIGSSLMPVYQRTLVLSVAGRYHLTNSFALGVNVNAGLISMNTSIARDFEDIRSDIRQRDPREVPSVEYARQSLLTDFHLSYVPISGKFNLMGSHIVHWDFYLTAGVGGALVSSDADDLSGFKFGPALGVGLRTFVQDNMAINIVFQDYLYSSADAQRFCCDGDLDPIAEPIDERFRNHLIGSVGVSFFFPSDVRVSR